MRGKGISYDTGFVENGAISRKRFDPAVVGREMRIIRDDLHCTAVRVWAATRNGLSRRRRTPPIWVWRSGSPPTPWN